MDDHERLKVVHAVRSDAFAGVERYITTISNELTRRGHTVVTIGGEQARVRGAVGGNVEVLPGARTYDVARRLAGVSRGADVVHVHMTAAEVVAVLSGLPTRTPVVATRHFAQPRGSTPGRRLALRLISRRLAAQISISRFVAAEVGEPTRTILNGVPDADAIDPRGRVVLLAQRLEPEKQTRDALTIWAASNLAADGWVLRIAGRGSELSALERESRQRGLVGVEFLGERDDLPVLREHAGLVLATAPAEPFGLTVAESMAAGIPVVASGAGGHLETVGAARTDLVYTPSDPMSAARILRSLADDVELRRRVGRDLRDFQRRELSIERHVDALVECYRDLVRKRSRRDRHTATT